MEGIHLFVIDPQNDFCHPEGALSVPGADADMERLAGFVDRVRARIEAVHVTLDSHRTVDISHPIWFVDHAGHHPAPFTHITADALARGDWRTSRPEAQERTLAYLRALEAGGRYPHVIWPEHCLVGSPGHNVWPSLFEALQRWSAGHALVEFVLKGTNPYTEHFSAIRAEVPDPDDPTTLPNAALLKRLAEAGTVVVAGQASSHCVAHSVRDLLDAVGDPGFAGRVVLLEDAMSPVAGFEPYAEAFLADMRERGVRVATTEQFAES